jgi:DNA-binding NtrC family response regulator
VVVVSADAAGSKNLARQLVKAGIDARAASRAEILAWDLAVLQAVEVAVVELADPGLAEMSVVEAVRGRSPMTEIVVVASDELVDGAVRAVRCGVHSVLRRPASAARLAAEIARACLRRREGEQRMAALADGKRAGA